MTTAVPDPRFRDQLAEVLKAHTVGAFAGCDSMCACDRKWRTNIAYREHLADALEARVQAAVNQRAAEELEAAANELSGDDGMGIVMDWQLRARAAALASPAPAPHAEESS